LTEVLAENAVGPAAVAASQGHALSSRSTLNTASTHIFWLSKLHSRIGELCKTSVARTGIAVGQSGYTHSRAPHRATLSPFHTLPPITSQKPEGGISKYNARVRDPEIALGLCVALVCSEAIPLYCLTVVQRHAAAARRSSGRAA